MVSVLRFSLAVLPVAVMQLVWTPVHAQESVNKELDACTKKEQITATAKGAAIGAFAGFAKAMLVKNEEKKNDDIAKNVLVGATAGGGIGWVTAYFTAVDKCYAKNPSWIPETKIERTKTFDQVKADLSYKPEMGVIVQARKVIVPESVKPGSEIEISSSFIVMTPDGAEMPVTVERRLFTIIDGKETPRRFNGKTMEERPVSPGEHVDIAHIPVKAENPTGMAYRIEFIVSAAKQPPSMVSATVAIK